MPVVDTTRWHRVDTGNFSLLIPPGYKRVMCCGTDSQIWEWEAAADKSIHFDFGLAEGIDDLVGKPGYTDCRLAIGGHPALVIAAYDPAHRTFARGPYIVLAYWPEFRFRIITGAPDSTEQTKLLATIRSVRFTR